MLRSLDWMFLWAILFSLSFSKRHLLFNLRFAYSGCSTIVGGLYFFLPIVHQDELAKCDEEVFWDVFDSFTFSSSHVIQSLTKGRLETKPAFVLSLPMHVAYVYVTWSFIYGGAKDKPGGQEKAILLRKSGPISFKGAIISMTRQGSQVWPRVKDTFVHACIYKKAGKLKEVLRSNGVSCSKKIGRMTFLEVAVFSNNKLATKLLLAKSAGFKENGRILLSAIAIAIELGYSDILEELVQQKNYQPKLRDLHLAFEQALLKPFRGCARVLAKMLCNKERAYLRPVGLCAADLTWLFNKHDGIECASARCKYLLERLNTKRPVESNRKNNVGEVVEVMLTRFECPICMECMIPSHGNQPQILSCYSDHWICGNCAPDLPQASCPTCRADLKVNPLRRRITAEKLAADVADLAKLVSAQKAR